MKYLPIFHCQTQFEAVIFAELQSQKNVYICIKKEEMGCEVETEGNTGDAHIL